MPLEEVELDDLLIRVSLNMVSHLQTITTVDSLQGGAKL